MAQRKPARQDYSGRRPKKPRVAPGLIALLVTLVWLSLVSAFFIFQPDSQTLTGDATQLVLTAVAVGTPIAMIWLAAIVIGAARGMRAETDRLDTAISAVRQAYLTAPGSGGGSGATNVQKQLEQIAAAQRKTELTLETFTSIRGAPSAEEKIAIPMSSDEPEMQPSLALGTPAETLSVPLSVADFIKAMNFPETEDKSNQLIQAAQDVLTLLSQDGIYMDDLRPDRAKPELWRKFAQGERGQNVSALGGVRDRSSLALTSGRMKQDPIFRDAVHHFLRKFDQTLAEFEPTATDQELSAFCDTRTARAFMLLGRVARAFD